MDNLTDLMDKKRFEEPNESKVIKDFVLSKYNSECVVSIQDHQIVIAVKSSALASNLRIDLEQLKKIIGDEKKIRIYTN